MNLVLFSKALLTFLGEAKDKSALGKGALVINTVRYITSQGSA